MGSDRFRGFTKARYVGRMRYLAIAVVGVLALTAAACAGGGGGGAATQPPSGATSAPGGGAADVNQELANQGSQLANQYGCLTCHTTDGSRLVGPTFQGLYGSQVTLEDGSMVTADEAYISESITDPDAKIVQGFQPGIMGPAIQQFESQIQSGNNLDALVEYIKSLS